MDHSKATIRTEVVSVSEDHADTLTAFLSLGREYLKYLRKEERERFLQSILARQREPDRWLLLLKYQNEYVGFVHAKIDRDERPGWGFILEFYIAPTKRKMGLGRTLFRHIANILQSKGVKNIWLLASPKAVSFWSSLGFRLTGEKDKETGQDIMVKSL